jgi:ComF family protein
MRFSRWAGFASEVVAAVVSPARCSACDAPVGRLAAFCAVCAASAVVAHDECADDLSAFVYGGAIARTVTRLKYERRPDLARPLGDLLAGALDGRARPERGCVVVPVPLHPHRLAERGFNPAALIGRRVARRFDVDLWPLALRRTRPTRAQATLDRTERHANVEAAFAARHPERIRGRAVLLIDDVRTTGATLEACAAALRCAGAADVRTAVVARAERNAPPL